jgi:hypothetical protein
MKYRRGKSFIRLFKPPLERLGGAGKAKNGGKRLGRDAPRALTRNRPRVSYLIGNLFESSRILRRQSGTA